MLKIHTLRALKDNFIYVLENTGGKCVVIDPGQAEPVIKFLRETRLDLTHILCTHHHPDHTAGITGLNAPVVAASHVDFPRIPGCNLALNAESGLELWGERVAEVLETPGHTLGQIAYYFTKEKALFVGDTLFSAGCGRLFEGTAEQMFSSLNKIKALPSDTQIYFGHEYTLNNLDFVLRQTPGATGVQAYREQVAERLKQGADSTPTSLETELQINPFLKASSVAEFKKWREARNHG